MHPLLPAFPFRKVQLIHTNEPIDAYNHAVSIPQGTINTARRRRRRPGCICVSIPQGTINTKTEHTVEECKQVSIPQGTINTKTTFQPERMMYVSIPQGTINTVK